MATTNKKSAKNKNKVKEQDIFVWHGVNRKGKKVSGELPANSVIELKSQLRKQGITPSRVKKKT
jgi:type IV pilus assembly protein PilC